MARVQIFLSTVSNEFRSYRDALRRDLTRHNVSIAVQEDFIPTGTETLDKLDEYIRHCDAVIHLVGDMTGALAKPASVAALCQRYPDFSQRVPPMAPFLVPDAPGLSYTQWEAWLALYHGKHLIIAAPLEGAAREPTYLLDEVQHQAQRAHLERLRSLARYPEIHFANADRLAVDVLRSKLQEVLARAGPVVRPMNLPFQTLGRLFKGRDTHLNDLARSLGSISEGTAAPVVARVLNGLGGVGKTRLAIEYAWRHAEAYSALLFVGADSAESLQRNLAALCARGILDLPEQTEREEAKQYQAVLNWLKNTPGWLLILDNVDSKQSAEAVEKLIPLLAGGHILITSRLADWSANLVPTLLDILSLETAIDFLLARTDAKRRKQTEDPVHARRLAEALGCLALALEQAGAYIDKQRLSFDGYLIEWKNQRKKVLVWFDKRLMQYHSSLAITWQTSFEQLAIPARRLLERLAWLAPDPIPEWLLNTPVPEDTMVADAFEALVALESYSLVTRATNSLSFSVHRLVQEVARRSQHERQSKDAEPTSLVEALRWVNAAFAGNPVNPSDWPALEPLLPHARTVSAHADAEGVPESTARLMNQAGLMLYAKAQYAEAEPLMKRALAIDEASYGAEHPKVAIRLNNLAQLLSDTNRLAEAEPLMKRALAIDEASYGAEHPNVARDLNNLALLLKNTNRLAEAEPLMKRALAIDEASYRAAHPDVAIDLNNLAQLLKDTNRLVEAEPLMKRALAIDEASYGAEHPNVARDLNNLAQLLSDTNRLAEAEPLMKRALSLSLSSLGNEHPNTRTVMENYVILLQIMGKAESEIIEVIGSLQHGST